MGFNLVLAGFGDEEAEGLIAWVTLDGVYFGAAGGEGEGVFGDGVSSVVALPDGVDDSGVRAGCLDIGVDVVGAAVGAVFSDGDA